MGYSEVRKMETIEDILREMRELAHDRMTDDGAYKKSVSVGRKLDEYADRIEAAYNFEKLEMKADQKKAGNVIIELTNKVIALTNANAELQNCVTGTCERRTLGIEPCACCPFGENDLLKDENAKLKAALKSVVDNYYTSSSMRHSIRNAKKVLEGAGK